MAGITLPPEVNPAASRSNARSDGTAGSARTGNTAATTGAAPVGAETRENAVDLSPLSRQAATIEATIDRSPAFDAEKVESLRQAIRDGSYRIDNDSLASAIIRLEQGR